MHARYDESLASSFKSRQEAPEMALYLIEAPHDEAEHKRAVSEVLGMAPGSQHAFVWGCHTGEHTAWAFIRADGRGEALDVVPHFLRKRTRVHRVEHYTANDVPSVWELSEAG
jgi:hypothetical protein